MQRPAGNEPSVTRVGPVTVVARPAQLSLALALAEQAGQPARWPGLGVRRPPPLRLVLVPDAATFERVARGRAPSWGAGLAFPGSRTIVLRSDEADLRRTLRHELAHLALHQAIHTRVPLWFDEGYAALAAGEWDRLDALRLSLLVLRRDIPDFDRLNAGLRGTASMADGAYALAMSAVMELERRIPGDDLAPLMRRLAAGEDFAAAVRETTGRTLDQYQDEWARTLRQRYNLLIWLAAGGFWTVMALMVVALWWYRRRADRPRRLALNEGWILPPEDPPPPSGD